MFLRADTLPPHRMIDYIPHSPSAQCIKPAVCPKYEFIRKTRFFDMNSDIDLISFKYCRFMPKYKRSPAVSKRSAAQQKSGRFRPRPLFVCMKKSTIEYGFAAMLSLRYQPVMRYLRVYMSNSSSNAGLSFFISDRDPCMFILCLPASITQRAMLEQ